MDYDRLDAKALLEQAEAAGRIYPMRAGWRRAQIFAGVCCCILIITIPLGIWIIARARKACVGLTEEGFAFRYLTTVAHRWSDIESFSLTTMNASMYGGGLAGMAVASMVAKRTEGLRGPLQFKLRGKKMPRMIPAHTIENSLEMARQMEQLSGLPILPHEETPETKPGDVWGTS